VNQYGRVSVLSDKVAYQPGRVDAAIPRGPWSFPIQQIERVAEKTYPVGPLIDWFILFSVGGHEFAVPTEAFEEEGLEEVLRAIGAGLGVRFDLGLANSPDLRERELFRR
jgi:hypothetical protein